MPTELMYEQKPIMPMVDNLIVGNNRLDERHEPRRAIGSMDSTAGAEDGACGMGKGEIALGKGEIALGKGEEQGPVRLDTSAETEED